MQTFHALVAVGSSYSFADGTGGGFRGQNHFLDTAAENRVQAFLQIFRQLNKIHDDITILKTDYQKHLLGFSVDEWQEILQQGIKIKEGYPEKDGAQIQAVRNEPFN